jgi:fluoroacetyl-CoA thioesterase
MEISDYIRPGITREQTIIITEEHTAAHVGSGSLRVLATPWMIAFIEKNARIMLDEYLPEGYSTVGVLVNVRHLAPSAVGNAVRVIAEVKSVEGSKVILGVAAWDGEEQIGAGIHERFVIDVERFLKRISKEK